MKRLLVILGLLFVAGVAIAGVLYVTFPGADDDLWRHGAQLSQVAGRAGRHADHRNESRLQGARSRGALTAARRRGMAECGGWRLAKLQQDADLAALLAARPDQREECREPEGPVHLRPRHVHCLRIRSDHGEQRSDRHRRVRDFLHQPGHVRRELAHAPGLSRRAPAGQPRRRLHGRPAVSRHTGLPGAGLRFQDRQAGVGDDDLRPETRRVGAVGADRLGWPRLRRQCRRRLQGRQGQGVRTRRKDRQGRLAVLPRPQGRRRRGPGPAGQVAARHVDLEQRARHTHQRRRDLDLVHARHQERFAVRPGRQSGPRFRLGGTRGRRISSPTRSWCSTPRRATTRTTSRS